MNSKDTPKIAARLASILIDTVVIVLYGALVFGIFFVTLTNMGDAVPHIDPAGAKFGTFALILPVMLLFMLLDYFAGGTIGKLATGLRVTYKTRAFWRSIVRNIVKFLPVFMYSAGVYMYESYDEMLPFILVLQLSALALGVILLAMALFAKDGRHFGDVLAGTRVVSKRPKAASEEV